MELCKQYVQHQLLALGTRIQDGEDRLHLLKSAHHALHYLLPLIDCLEADLNRLCFSLAAYTRAAELLCADEVDEEEVAGWMDELCDSERRSHEVCWREIEERRSSRLLAGAQSSNTAARGLSAQPAQHANSAKKRQRTEAKQPLESNDKLQQRQRQQQPKKRQRHHSPVPSTSPPLSIFQLPPLAHFGFPADMIESLTGRPCPSAPAKLPNGKAHTSRHSPVLSPTSSATPSPATSDAEDIVDEQDEDEEDDDEEEDDEDGRALQPSAHSYDTPYLLPPIATFSDQRSTQTTLLTFVHRLPLSHYFLHCLPIPKPGVPPSSWSQFARQAHTLLCEMNRDGGGNSSNGYYLLLVSASSLLVSASYLTLTEHSGRYTLAVNCFCTRREMQGRGCGRVLYEAIRELRCRICKWLRLTRPGSSATCQLVVHSHPATEAMWMTRFGLQRMKKGMGYGGYTNTIPLSDGRRGMEDRRREWVERVVRSDEVCGKEK